MPLFSKVIVGIILIFVALFYLSKTMLPPIMLPIGAQHKTIGELPLVEVMDDGEFYEKDGQEYSCKGINRGALINACNSEYMDWDGKRTISRERTKKEKKECFKQIEVTIKNSYQCIPRCSDLKKIGAFWTCWDAEYGGGIGWK